MGILPWLVLERTAASPRPSGRGGLCCDPQVTHGLSGLQVSGEAGGPGAGCCSHIQGVLGRQDGSRHRDSPSVAPGPTLSGVIPLILQFPQRQVLVCRENQEAWGLSQGEEDEGTLRLVRPPPQGGQHFPLQCGGEGLRSQWQEGSCFGTNTFGCI